MGSFLVGDGSVRIIINSTGPSVMQRLTHRADGEPIDDDEPLRSFAWRQPAPARHWPAADGEFSIRSSTDPELASYLRIEEREVG